MVTHWRADIMDCMINTRRGFGVDFQVTSAFPTNMLVIFEDDEGSEVQAVMPVYFSGYILRLPFVQIMLGDLL